MPSSHAFRDVGTDTSAPSITNYKLPIPAAFSVSALRLPYFTFSVTTSPCAAPPAAVAVTVICDVPTAVGAATVRKADPGAAPVAGVAVTVTVAGFGTTAGGV